MDLTGDPALAAEKKFVVVGRVKSADGTAPLEGVEITASAGIGTLHPTGSTTTDQQGRFRLIFTPGILLSGGKSGGTAIVHARKPGWYAWTYGWPAQFTLSDEPLKDEEMPPKTTNLVPGRPAPLEFRMQPAASLKFLLHDAAGNPIKGQRVLLTGENLPPGASVIADGRTDESGEFRVSDVPRRSFRLVLEPDRESPRQDLEVGSICFRDAAVYSAVATVYEWTPEGTHVDFQVRRRQER